VKSWIIALSIAVLTSLVCALIVATGDGPETSGASTSSVASARPPGRSHFPAELARRDDPSSDPAPSATPEVGGTAPPASPPPAQTAETARDHIAEVFTGERLDGSWDGAELARLEKALPTILPTGSQITRVECRSTMCRIESSHPSVDQFAEFARSAFLKETRVNEGPFFASVTSPVVAGQPVTTVAYIARKGHILPMPERIATAQ
jgi:hypothetical protein